MLCHCDKPHAGPASLDIRHVIDLSLNVLVGRDYDLTYTPSAQVMHGLDLYTPGLLLRLVALVSLAWLSLA